MIDINGIAKMFEKFAKQITTASSSSEVSAVKPSQSLSGAGGGGSVVGAVSGGSTPKVISIRFAGPGLCLIGPDGKMVCVKLDGKMSLHEAANILKQVNPGGTVYCLFSPGSPMPRCAPSIEQLLSGNY